MVDGGGGGGVEKHSDLILGIPRSKLPYTTSCIEIIIGLKKNLIIFGIKPRMMMKN